MKDAPWWNPAPEDLTGWDEPLPAVIRLAPDYCADLPLWGDGFGNIAWQFTKFRPALLDRLAAWQQDFDRDYHWQRGWSSATARSAWVDAGRILQADVRAELGDRADLVTDLWPAD